MNVRRAIIAGRLLALTCLSATLGAAHDRRVVDRVTVGDAQSERDHGYAGDAVTAGVAGGRTFRQTRAWLRYALAVFDDTEVTVVCSFAGGDDAPRTFALMVENRDVATYSLAAHSASGGTVEFRIPFDITRGRTNILVTVRASGGATPALLELRTLQDHLEE